MSQTVTNPIVSTRTEVPLNTDPLAAALPNGHRGIASRLRYEAPLQNTYLFLRHEFALSNELGVLASDPASSVGQLGLHPKGITAAELLGQRVAEIILECESLELRDIRIFTSPLPRALQTAKIITDAMNSEWSGFGAALSKPISHDSLRERGWGTELEGLSVEHWRQVRSADAGGIPLAGVEECSAFLSRITGFFVEQEALGSGKLNIAITHCDSIQAASMVTVQNHNSGHYSAFQPLDNGAGIILGRPLLKLSKVFPRPRL